MKSGRSFLAVASVVVVLFLGFAGCSGGVSTGSLSVALNYGDGDEGGGGTVSGVRSAPLPLSDPRASYPRHDNNWILIRVDGPHLSEPIERWFLRSAGRGQIDGILPGEKIVVEVTEYDNTAASVSDNVANAPLLGRGWARGITLRAGESRTVPVTMFDKGTLVRVCGADNTVAPGTGTPGDTGDGGLAVSARLGTPVAISVGPDDSIFVSSSQYNRIRRIDRFGYIDHFAGAGDHDNATLVDNAVAATAKIGPAFDVDVDGSGNVYIATWWQEVLRVDGQTGLLSVKYAGPGITTPPIGSKPDIAVRADNVIFFSTGIENKIWVITNGTPTPYVDNMTGNSTAENTNRLRYPTITPTSLSMDSGLRLGFVDNNLKIKGVSTVGDNVSTLIGGGEGSFVDGIAPLLLRLDQPVLFAADPNFEFWFYREDAFNGLRYRSPVDGFLHSFAGTGAAGYSGDDGLATSATFRDPASVAVDSRGNVYIADTNNHAIRMVVGGAHR